MFKSLIAFVTVYKDFTTLYKDLNCNIGRWLFATARVQQLTKESMLMFITLPLPDLPLIAASFFELNTTVFNQVTTVI